RLYVEPGITVNVGEPLLAFEVEGDAASNAGADRTADAAGALDVATAAIPDDAGDVAEPNLVGYGATSERPGRPARRARVISGSGVSPVSLARLSSPDALSATADQLTPASSPEAPERPRSTPPVRKLARDLGIELEQIAGTGEQGVITREDVQRAVSPDGQHEPGAALQHEHATSAALQHATSAPPVPTKRETRGSIERETRSPIKGVRKYTAEAMVASAFTAPHVTTFLTVDVTPTLELLAHLKQLGEFSGYRLNFLTAVAKAVCIAVARTPVVNSRWDESAGEIVQFNYVNLGIAAATPRGLMVPTIKDADHMTLPDLATALADLVETAKAGRTNQEQLSGGTISITNVGVFGVDAGTPILNPGEAAILAVGAIRRRPWEHEGQIALRDVVTLSLSFDHRLVDGEQGSRFLADVGAILAEPGIALTMV
ncbi:MAG TPA: dihydrolipoamide acetyltransferase family protein, partial [Microbacteriaceae bacterium]|nr:dihydrolipoamide acetyltransferase family protein [Microbacteriaceae bacterium]